MALEFGDFILLLRGNEPSGLELSRGLVNDLQEASVSCGSVPGQSQQPMAFVGRPFAGIDELESQTLGMQSSWAVLYCSGCVESK